MSILFNPELDSALNANGTESVKDIDAGLFQGVGRGVSTGFSNAGTSLQRIGLTTLGRGQMQVAAAQMQATANITGNEALSNAAQDVLSAPEPTEDQLPQYKSFDSDQVGAVGTILGGLVQQSPSLALMAVNPVAGVSVAGAQGYTEAHAEGARLGLTGEDLEDYSAVGGAAMAAGSAIPGFTGVGKGAVLYGSRFLAGGVVNSITGEVDRWGRAEILDSAGFHDQARQMRQADAASRVTEFVLGGAFGLLGGGHRTETGRTGDLERGITSIHEDAATAHIIHDNYVTETAPGLSADARSEAGHVAAMDSAIDSVNSGRGVDVTDHLTGDRTFIVHGDIDAGNVARQQLAGDSSKRIDAVVQAADRQAIPEKVNSYSPGVLSDATDQPFQLLREQMDAVAENHPELRDLVAQHIDNFEAEHTTARRNAELYDVAAACALKFGS
ncbi:TPA: hypothetical protein ACW71V_004526 [Klebsiella aerogenes]|uniref:hypothetical protein n=1 Tax=Klebsiella aerogenes TaxID=548 RepID=UPI0004505F2C|nr:hypothetical protein [Klebsiella aerogenes]EIV9530651.1 hypothetical protein [Klebsiella aerogenes]EUL75801.1 hypothetical protein P831_04377 [Klebsiella aerogenes UCI 28]EUL83337.1 hypothetical protein P830_02352 [Klebsiella aerogenes UCI 27]KLF09136.1 hypothetical protein YA26_22115 [Klebsiella aerogenes]KLF61782.1 hypothetical protein YA37_15110 [Klebsiella aerogenes]